MAGQDGRSEINRRLMQVIHNAIGRDGFARRDIEHMAGASSPTVSDWFHKGAVPDAVTIGRLCRGLRVNAHWVITGQGPKSPPGEGKEKADELFAVGAAAVLQSVQQKIAAVEAEFSATLLSHESAIQRARAAADAALATGRLEAQRADRTPGRRHQARRRKAQ